MCTPVRPSPPRVSGVLPVLVSMTVCGEAVAPVGTSPKSSMPVSTVTSGATPVPTTEKAVGESGASELTITDWAKLPVADGEKV